MPDQNEEEKLEKKYRIQRFILLLGVLAFTIFCIVILCTDEFVDSEDVYREHYYATQSALATQEAASYHEVVYEVRFSAPVVEITFKNDSGNTEWRTNITQDQTYTYKMKSGDILYLSVKNGDSKSSISCGIYVDGSKVERAYSVGSHVTATCSGSVE